MRLLSVRPDDIDAPVFRGRPVQFAAEELILPNRLVHIPSGVPITVKDEDGTLILERFGVSGIVAQRDGESDEDMLWRAKETRYNFLVRHLTNYRQLVNSQLASGSPVPLPTPEMRALNAEYGRLSKEILANDPVLKAALPTVEPQPIADVMGEELASFGVGKRVAPFGPPEGAATDVPGL